MSYSSALRQLFIPNGIVLLGAGLLLEWKLQSVLPVGALGVIGIALSIAAILLGWRLRAPRLMLTAALVLVAEHAWTWLGHAHAPGGASLLAVLLPLNFALLLLVDETCFDWEALAWWGGVLAVQVVAVAVVTATTGASVSQWLARPFIPGMPAERLPQVAILLFLAAGLAQLVAFFVSRKPRDSGMFWALCGCALGLAAAGPKLTAGLFATAALLVAVSVIETAYLVGYHDELTALPARRAFNQAVAALDDDYAIAMVDIDHFKQFNDTFGHDVGDQVLRMVAAKMRDAEGGRVFRYGGEEFAIIFRNADAEEAAERAESVRESIARSKFVVRGLDRSQRKRQERRRAHRPRKLKKQRIDTRVTVSIGIAEPVHPEATVQDVIQAADKALYRAKDRGRNRVEVAGARPVVKGR